MRLRIEHFIQLHSCGTNEVICRKLIIVHHYYTVNQRKREREGEREREREREGGREREKRREKGICAVNTNSAFRAHKVALGKGSIRHIQVQLTTVV